MGFKQMLVEADAVIETISVEDALALVEQSDVTFVDVREVAEVQKSGMIAGAVHAPRGFLEFLADPESPMFNAALGGEQRLVLYCGSGGRSTLAAKTMAELGRPNVCHMAGGWAAWTNVRGPMEPVG